VGLLNIPAAISNSLLFSVLQNMLAPHLEQKPLLAILDDWYHFRVFFEIKVTFSSGQQVYAA
jgi:hypothetical protein